MRKLMVLLVAVIALAACGSSKGSDAVPSFDGIWKANDFVATIKADSIEIDIVNKDTSSLYWKGTFPQDTDTTEIVSQGDTAAMYASLVGSQDSTKTFTFDGEKLSYKFTIMGTTQTIHLEKKA